MNSLPFLASLATAAPGFVPGMAVESCAPPDEPPSRWRFLIGLLAAACLLACFVTSRP